MKNIYIFLFILPLFSQSQIINFPDSNFKSLLLAANVNALPNTLGYHIAQNSTGDWVTIDYNNDGEIQQSEALEIYYLRADNFISDLTGLEFFSNLTSFGIFNSPITFVDLSILPNLEYMGVNRTLVTAINLQGLTNLKDIYCIENSQLTSLDIAGLISLESIWCEKNQLTSIIFGNNISLKFLACNNNQLTTLDVRNLPALENLVCENNLLTSLELNGLQNLSTLHTKNNYLTSINFTNVLLIWYVECNNNQLTSLDFSDNPIFEYLNCKNNNLTSIKIKNGFQQNFYYWNWGNNPNLNYICADAFEIPGLQDFLYSCQITQPVTIDSNCNLVTSSYDQSNIVIAPNPVIDLLFFNKNDAISISSINIFNTLGQLVLVLNPKETQSVDVSSLKSGNYFVKITSDKGSATTRFIKM